MLGAMICGNVLGHWHVFFANYCGCIFAETLKYEMRVNALWGTFGWMYKAPRAPLFCKYAEDAYSSSRGRSPPCGFAIF